MGNSDAKSDPRKEQLRQICEEVIKLKESPLYAERIKNKVYPVIGEGNHYARVMFIGEAPGKNEAATGRPFCGAAGKILDEMLASIGMPREQVYITNIVKDRPPNNRDPLPEEIAIYAPFLDRQINVIQPAIIATLGRFSMQYIMEKMGLGDKLKSITQLHGLVFTGQAAFGAVQIMPFYHPAATIYNRQLRGDLEKDFKKLKQVLNEL